MKNGTDWSPYLAVYGDLGADNAQSLGQLQQEVHRGVYDAIIHDGDFAYNMESVIFRLKVLQELWVGPGYYDNFCYRVMVSSEMCSWRIFNP